MMLLQVHPGDTALTRMPSGARSIAWLRVSCRIAALETGWSQRPVWDTRDEIEPKLTIAPLVLARCGRAAFINITEPTRLTSRALSHSSRVDAAPLSR